ncbi:thioredoxin family protein [Protofrankia symbiont of Coriaria ruscifolia]|uniref:thioredoxin family protein n=1 Tax=Protofrankia symbiont of Coriaria ruscifolia TaxID=1306542 RepID=UPI001F5EA73A|nr:thioredoxin family protein [Protofrankia symbiont of Coriaria ruscifolia]
MTGLWVLMVAVGCAVGAALFIRLRDGRFHMVRPDSPASAPTVSAVPDAPVVNGEVVNGEVANAAAQASAHMTAHPEGGGAVPAVDAELVALGVSPEARATLLQFSTAFCAPCRATRRILADVAGSIPGVRHVEVDAESHLELVRRLRIRRTPTVLVLDSRAREVCRASGAPPGRRAVLAALELAVGEPHGQGAAAARDGAMIDASDRLDWPSDR